MSRLCMVLLALLFALPASASDDPAVLQAEIAYVGDPGDLRTTFVLIDQNGGQVLWSSRNVERTQNAGIITVTAPLRDGDWQPNGDIRWCIELDATRARDTVEFKALRQVTPQKTWEKSRGGRDLQGKTGRTCIRGSTHDGY